MSKKSITDISLYRTEIVKVLKETFLFKKDIAPLDISVLNERYRSILDNVNGFIILCNYTTGQYEYVSDSIQSTLGYNLKGYTTEQLTSFVVSIIHEKHRDFILNSLLPVVFKYFKENSTQITGTDYRYTVSMKLKNIYNIYEWYLVDTVIIEVDENGFPLRTLITSTNINAFKKDEPVYYNIMKKNADGIYEIVLEGTENNAQDQYLLTQREVQIISLISQGYTNKEIADKLFISEHTIKTHRKNILKKTQCKGTAELTTFAFSRGLL